MGSVNNIYQCESEINEVSRGRYNNSNYKGGYNKGNSYKGKNDYYGKKDWNKNTKGSYQKKEDKKESKDKDVYLKFHCPTGFNENIFACACKMIQEKVDNAGQAGVTDIKTINTVEKDNCTGNWRGESWFIRRHLRLTTEGLHTRKLFEQWQ